MKYLKTFEKKKFKYKIGDYVEISPVNETLPERVIVKIDRVNYDGFYLGEYQGCIEVPYDPNRWVEFFNEDEIFRKVSEKEVEFLKKVDKYNL